MGPRGLAKALALLKSAINSQGVKKELPQTLHLN